MTYETFLRLAQRGVVAVAVRDNRAVHGLLCYPNTMAHSPRSRDRAANAIVACRMAHQRAPLSP